MSEKLDITIWEKFARGWVPQHISTIDDILPPLSQTTFKDARSVVWDDDEDDDDDI